MPRGAGRFGRAPAACPLCGRFWGREGLDLIEGRARLLNDQGRDVSAAFVRGARQVARLAQQHGVRLALLKDRSPSCGWDPAGMNPAGGPGQGVLATVLKAVGIEVREVRANGRG